MSHCWIDSIRCVYLLPCKVIPRFKVLNMNSIEAKYIGHTKRMLNYKAPRDSKCLSRWAAFVFIRIVGVHRTPCWTICCVFAQQENRLNNTSKSVTRSALCSIICPSEEFCILSNFVAFYYFLKCKNEIYTKFRPRPYLFGGTVSKLCFLHALKVCSQIYLIRSHLC